MHFLTTASPQFLAQQATVQAKKVLKAYSAHRGPGNQFTHFDDAWLREPYSPEYRQTFVYFIAESCGPVKIGHGARPRERLGSLQVGNCRRLHLLSYVEGPREAETRLHQRLSEYRMSGEWYAPEAEVFAAIDACERVFGAAHRLECEPCARAVRIEESRWKSRDFDDRTHTCGAWRAEQVPPGLAAL